MSDCVYVRAEIGGIQHYICSTGKLKEMIGGSEIIRYLTESFYVDQAIRPLGLRAVEAPEADKDWYVPVQASAGIISLIVPSQEIAAKFLTALSSAALAYFPGLPLYGASAPMEFNITSYKAARREADNGIAAQRALTPVACGMPMLPVTQASRLDGLPVACEKDDEKLSLPSQCRTQTPILDKSRNRLRGYLEHDPAITPRWADNLDVMLGDTHSRIALIRMDGNDLGKHFRDELQKAGKKDLKEGIADIRKLSANIDAITTQSFKYAASAILTYLLRQRYDPEPMMPMRPLVIGGDDITVIIRADLSLVFIELFTRRFEALSQEKLGKKLSLGIGMVAMNKSWPFARAFELAESLLENAKHATLAMEERPSSLDYISITEEVEHDINLLRQRVYKAATGELLTTKPLLLDGPNFEIFLKNGKDIASYLSRSLIRGAWTEVRKGRAASASSHLNLKDNINRGLGGRDNRHILTPGQFARIFPDSFFILDEKTGSYATPLGDYLELEKLLPQNWDERLDFYGFLAGREKKNA